MSTHKICFHGEIRKMSTFCFGKNASSLISSTVCSSFFAHLITRRFVVLLCVSLVFFLCDRHMFIGFTVTALHSDKTCQMPDLHR